MNVETISGSYDDLGIDFEKLETDRTKFTIELTRLGKITVVNVPAPLVTKEERLKIEQARRSYQALWGGASLSKRTRGDVFDGWSKNSPFETTHQIATIDFDDGSVRTMTNRKVAVMAGVPAPRNLWDDLTFWRVVDQDGCVKTFEESLLGNSLKIDPHEIAAISRTGTYPYEGIPKDEGYREAGAIAWALMQIAALHDNIHNPWICMLGPAFRDSILTIQMGPERVKLDFTPTEQTFGWTGTRRLELDWENPNVAEHKLKFPGYWLDSESLLETLTHCLNERIVTLEELGVAFDKLPEQERGGKKNELLRLVTEARNAKHLIRVFMHNQKLAQVVVSKVKCKPFSATLLPENWRESNLRLLRAAKEKYG